MKKNAETRTSLRRKLMPLLIAGCFAPSAAWANPSGAQVVSGQVSFDTKGNTLTITNSHGSIIKWDSFSINAGEVTKFQQSANSSVLNRVVGKYSSEILGTLQSEGRVFLINPNGILFGQGAQINVNGLVASTLDITNEDFWAGKMKFQAGSTAGNLKNEGKITTPNGGQVYLIAPNVENTGIITSPRGEVVLAAGHTVQLVDSADPDLHVVISAPDNQSLNLGEIIAAGGKAGIYGALIKQRGIISADSAVVGESGKIVFKASKETILDAGSKTSATGAGRGGEIHVLGERIGVLGDAKIDASGQTGGGTVLVGGDYQGKNAAMPNAKSTYIGKDAQIKADAIGDGDGGKLIIWSDEVTRVYGSLSARGGAAGGNGGLIETSGHYLDVAGIRVNAGASKGKTGTWLLDPYDIEVAASGSDVLTDFDNYTKPPNTGVSTISANTISGATADVILQAQHDITFNAAVDITAPGVGLYASAGNDIVVNQSIETYGGAISLNANYLPSDPGNTTGAVRINNALTSNGGEISLNGKSIAVGGAVSAGSGETAGMVYLSADNIQLGTGAGSSIEGRLVQLSANSAGGTISTAGAPSTISAFTDVELTADNTDFTGLTINAGQTIEYRTYTEGRDIRTSALMNALFNAPVLLMSNAGFNGAMQGNIIVDRAIELPGKTVFLETGGTVSQSAPIIANALGVNSGRWDSESSVVVNPGGVFLDHPGNTVGYLAGSTMGGAFNFTNSQGINVANVAVQPAAAYGIRTGGGNISLRASGGDIAVNKSLDAGTGNVTLTSDGAISMDQYEDYGDGIMANHLSAEAKRGIGIISRVSSFSAINTDTFGSSAIVIDNKGALTVNEVRQAGNGGDITISSQGEFLEGDPNSPDSPSPSYAPGNITVASGVNAGTGTVMLRAADAIIDGGGTVIGNRLVAEAYSGIALNTSVSALVASNAGSASTSDISIKNTGPLSVEYVWQAGSGNISIDNIGAMTVAATTTYLMAGSPVPQAGVFANTGNISLVTHSPLTINGAVSTAGNIALEAGASNSVNDILTINGPVSAGGTIALTAGAGIVINQMPVGSSVTQTANQNSVLFPPPVVPPSVVPPSLVPSASIAATINNVNSQITSMTERVTQDVIIGGVSGDDDGVPDPGSGGGNQKVAINNNGAKRNEAAKMYCN
ncbi:filamentous hemagglutinin N-terminal domain-containing protein [Noviherbaspirillum cavernae]|uniref:Filamentous hemagglutinin N-terminal domain-containing protein n=1 Tax=Noviherbaspirillum cavernae TaxID=2320862 RepID=A0A418X2V9_9BURK|nr:filamentous hemagglutinin N-terminal domain-containing protein [Noviherbaspirillum cavernae]RJG06808.1 filamentous hemagglutinin N-terminal domain-containing protein [Noviherbaspirillum cavernae]